MGEEEQGFVIKDRRQFTTEGELKETEEEKTEKTEPAGEQRETPGETEHMAEENIQTPFPEVTFSTFILSLVSSTLVHLGDAPDPSSGKTSPDLNLAKHTIDMIAMLKQKTDGNLTKDEQAMIESVLYDLRMRYVSKKD